MVTTADREIFIDANILIYADLTSSPLHATARERLIDLHTNGGVLWISGQVIREYLAALTRGQTFSMPVPPAEAAASVRKIMSQFEVANEAADASEKLLELIERFDVKGKQVHDANIVATMLAKRIRRLLTHNIGDFERYSSVIEIVPLVAK